MKYKVKISMLILNKEPFAITIELEADDIQDAEKKAMEEVKKKYWLVSHAFKMEEITYEE